jgi:hypothetical protein
MIVNMIFCNWRLSLRSMLSPFALVQHSKGLAVEQIRETLNRYAS